MIKIYNTLTRKKEKFKPINSKKVSMYVCGVTPYNLCHIGHGRTFIVFDTIIRYLKYKGYKINYVRNITDIEDKIIAQAKKNKESTQALTHRMILEMQKDFDSLSILKPNHEPLVTKNIHFIIQLIEKLLLQKNAYINKFGDVMFSVKSFKNYGVLSKQNLKKLKNNFLYGKENKEDFVLWKISKVKEPTWNSPWGKGRPGWHIECSALSRKILGSNFDIHGGGSDLIFPHHENEIAQSFCLDSSYANIWIHVGIVTVHQKKMSKSLGNFITIKNLLKFYDEETIRYFLMSKHYRKPIDFNEKKIQQAQSSLRSLYTAIQDVNFFQLKKVKYSKTFLKKFIEIIEDDFNIPKIYSLFFELVHRINFAKKKNRNTMKEVFTLRKLANIIGLLKRDSYSFLENKKMDLEKLNIIKQLILARNIARKNKEWYLADKIRNQLYEMNIVVEDSKKETKWKEVSFLEKKKKSYFKKEYKTKSS